MDMYFVRLVSEGRLEMKYRVMTSLFVLLVIAVSLASAQKISGGIKVGMNLANFYDVGDEFDGGDLKPKMGFCGGAFIAFGVGRVVVIQPELLYSQKGAKFDVEFMDWKITYMFNYLEIPIFIKTVFPVQGKVKPNLFLGPYFGFTITDPQGRVEIDGTIEETDLTDVENTDFGVVFGSGVDFELGKGKIVFDVRYDLGLATLDKADDDDDVKNSVFSFLIGYAF